LAPASGSVTRGALSRVRHGQPDELWRSRLDIGAGRPAMKDPGP
jgi:hypothetical protein